MNAKNMNLYIAVGLVALAIVSLFEPINQGIIACVSISTLLFTVAQTCESYLESLEDDAKSSMEVSNKAMGLNVDEETMLLFKTYLKYDDSDRKKKIIRKIIMALNCISFVTLFGGFVIPININPKLSNFVSILSMCLLFVSLWLVEKHRNRKAQWNELLMLSMILQKTNKQNEVNTDEQLE